MGKGDAGTESGMTSPKSYLKATDHSLLSTVYFLLTTKSWLAHVRLLLLIRMQNR